MTTRGWVAVGIVAAVLVAALVIVYTSLSSSVNSLEGQVDSSQAQLASTRQQVTKNAAAVKSSGQAQVAKLSTRVAKIENCVPELQAQVDGLNISTNTQTVYGVDFVTSAFLQNNQQVSRPCTKFLRPTTGP